MPIDPMAENTIEDENDADFELDDLFRSQIIDQRMPWLSMGTN
jgi:hypothetical protein